MIQNKGICYIFHGRYVFNFCEFFLTARSRMVYNVFATKAKEKNNPLCFATGVKIILSEINLLLCGRPAKQWHREGDLL